MNRITRRFLKPVSVYLDDNQVSVNGQGHAKPQFITDYLFLKLYIIKHYNRTAQWEYKNPVEPAYGTRAFRVAESQFPPAENSRCFYTHITLFLKSG